MKILAVDPYLARSHAAFLEGLRKYSRHEIDVMHLPPRKWKWRMRSSGVTLGRLLEKSPESFKGPYHALLATDFLPLADFKAAAPEAVAKLPTLYYFHENQLTYPVRHEDERDFHFAFTNAASAVLADRVLFNTEFHRRDFLAALKKFVKKMPEKDFLDAPEVIESKSGVLPLGIDLDEFDVFAGPRSEHPLVVWNHRWEYDKNPEAFFGALREVKKRGVKFALAVMGESFREYPEVFEAASEEFAEETVCFGFVESREDYVGMLASSDIAVSTANHEFFGLSVVEALAAGCAPLLPERLSYPEILPSELHDAHLYKSDADLPGRLEKLIKEVSGLDRDVFCEAAARFDWKAVAARFDEEMDALA